MVGRASRVDKIFVAAVLVLVLLRGLFRVLLLLLLLRLLLWLCRSVRDPLPQRLVQISSGRVGGLRLMLLRVLRLLRRRRCCCRRRHLSSPAEPQFGMVDVVGFVVVLRRVMRAVVLRR